MIEPLIQLIVILVVGGVAYYLITLLPLPAPFPVVIQVLVILILLLVVVFYIVPGLHFRPLP